MHTQIMSLFREYSILLFDLYLLAVVFREQNVASLQKYLSCYYF